MQKNMFIPNYRWKGSLNLMSSIQNWCWVQSKYDELDFLKSSYMKKFDNIILFVIDWLGYERIKNYWKWSFLEKYCIEKITSVFPSSTASSVTTFLTGVPPEEHAILWFNMRLKESATIVQVLPWRTKSWKFPLKSFLNPEDVFVQNNFFEKSNCDTFVVTHRDFWISNYNNFYNKTAKVFYYENLKNCFTQTIESVYYNNKKKYIYSYRDKFDTKCHSFWIDDKKVFEHFEYIDNYFEILKKKLIGSNTLLLVTADHGQINIPDENIIYLNIKHPELIKMLNIPLAWENRCHYCFVKNWFKQKFKDYVQKHLSDICDIFSINEIIEKEIYWLWNPNMKFFDRVGDYVLIAKNNYTIYDTTIWDKIDEDIWHHGGTTKQEMFVPLIKIECK
jgi:predicted AlkP superfamily pyrophosphatase or phosphodiesterase